MKNLGLIVPVDYKLLSIAAILDVFETVNRIYAENKHEIPFRIHIIRTPEQIEQEGFSFYRHAVISVKSDLKLDLVLIPSFTTDNMTETLSKNKNYIPWLQSQYTAGAEIG